MDFNRLFERFHGKTGQTEIPIVGRILAKPSFDSYREYNAGDTAFYHEEQAIYKVKVLANRSNKKSVAYKLEGIEGLRPPRRPFRDLNVGEIIRCRKLRQFGAVGCLWELADTPNNGQS